MNIHRIIDKAIKQYGKETVDLEFLPQNRYNKDLFLTTGQYDWFSGQVLYCLIRYLKPRRVLEISTASGYATTYMAMAMKKNNWGKVDTYELDPKAAQAAIRLFQRYGLDRFIDCRIGDAMKTSRTAPFDYAIYFLDSLHTEEFARWFIESHVMRSDRIDALFHMHDILPVYARVRRYNEPPFEASAAELHMPRNAFSRVRENLHKLLHRRHDSDQEAEIPIQVYPPENIGSLETFDGNCTTEAIWGNKLAALIKPDDHVFLYDIADLYPELHARAYDHAAIGRTDSQNQPMEWNESWWCTVSALKAAYHKLANVSVSAEDHDDTEQG